MCQNLRRRETRPESLLSASKSPDEAYLLTLMRSNKTVYSAGHADIYVGEWLRLAAADGIGNNQLYERHTKMWMKWYGTGSGSDLVVSGTALSERTRSLPLPVPYQREILSNPHLGVPLI